MPTRSNKSSKSSASQTTAKGKTKKKGAEPSPTAGADPPIIVDGGGSIAVDLPPKFKDEGSTPNGGKKYKHDLGNLTNMVITSPDNYTVNPTSGDITVKLKSTSKITVNYG